MALPFLAGHHFQQATSDPSDLIVDHGRSAHSARRLLMVASFRCSAYHPMKMCDALMLSDIIPDADYRFQIRLDPIGLRQFFGPTPEHDRLIRERRHWLAAAPHTYSALLPDGAAPLAEALQLLGTLDISPGILQNSAETDSERCLNLGRQLEPDFLLLTSSTDSEIRLCGGCVCFPSSWSLTEKLGHSIEFIHGVVPGLNAQIGTQIHTFLTRLKPGLAWTRTNWGLSSSPDLNQHPERRLPRIDKAAGIAQIWFRVERQALVALPRSGGILFGIRISMHPLTQLRADPIAAHRLVRALSTMPEPVARYKGLDTARANIIRLLES